MLTVKSGDVLAVVVTFHPQPERLRSLLEALGHQVRAVLVVDNTPNSGNRLTTLIDTLGGALPNVRLVAMGKNVGIAAAQNIGIRMALDEGFRYVLLSDQDSEPCNGMVDGLVSVADILASQGVAVGCVCPEYFDSVTRQVYRFQVQPSGKFFYRSVAIDPAQAHAEIVTTISSGTLIPRAALELVGPMREDFFIDHVDTEWCLRARARGLRNFGTARVRLTHRLGDGSFRAWYFGWRSHSEYSPTRLYYRYRNFVLLCRLPHVPVRWALRASWYWLGNAYAHCLFARRRLVNFHSILHGLWDGARGRSGAVGSTR